jgi:type VI protein secretion system component VasF
MGARSSVHVYAAVAVVVVVVAFIGFHWSARDETVVSGDAARRRNGV